MIHMGNELLYCAIENRAHCFSSFLCPFFFCLFRLKVCHNFTQELCKLECSNVTYMKNEKLYHGVET